MTSVRQLLRLTYRPVKSELFWHFVLRVQTDTSLGALFLFLARGSESSEESGESVTRSPFFFLTSHSSLMCFQA